MTLKLDKAGRVLLPKSLRERLKLRAGSMLEIVDCAEGILLRPVGQPSSMVQKDGIWVHTGKLPHKIDWNRIFQDTRDERIREVAGV